ncbi:MAG: GNAT family protein [Planctomycetota bacterium]
MIKFIPGKIIEQFKSENEIITFRFPKLSDVKNAMDYVNAIITEKNSRIMRTKKVTLSEERKWLKGIIELAKQKIKLPLFIEAKGNIVGTLDIRRSLKPPSATDHGAWFGITLAKSYRGRGIATRSVRTLFKLGKQMWKLRIIKSSYMSDNSASVALHKKLGFKFAGIIPKDAKYGNKYVDSVILFKELK